MRHDSAPHSPRGHAPSEEGRPSMMRLLATHVPISLIMDLAMPAGPHSDELLDMERRMPAWGTPSAPSAAPLN